MRTVLWIITVFVCIFLVAPVFVVFPLAFSTSEFLVFPPPGYSSEWFIAFFHDQSWTDALLRSLMVGAASTLLAVVLGALAAYAIAKSGKRVGHAVKPLLTLPIVVPSVVFGAGAYLIITRFDINGGLWPLILGHALLALPFVLTMVGAALTMIDPSLELAAKSLGAPPARAAVDITARLALPALVIAAVISFVTSLDEVVVALFLTPDRSPTLPVRMFSSIRYELDPLVPVASSIVILITVVCGVLCAIAFRSYASVARQAAVKK